MSGPISRAARPALWMALALCFNACSNGAAEGDSSSSGTDDGKIAGAADGGGAAEAAAGNAACLGGTHCADDSDCKESGFRCNKQLSPSQCHQLYCAPAGEPCSDDVFCAAGTECFDHTCGACTDCRAAGGPECADVSSDEKYCGSCGVSCYHTLLPSSNSYSEANPAGCHAGFCAKEFHAVPAQQKCADMCAALPAIQGGAGWTCLGAGQARYSRTTVDFKDVEVACGELPAATLGEYQLSFLTCICLSK